MKKLLLAATASAALSTATPANAGTEPFIGEVSYLPFTFCPRGFVEAKGQLLSIASNTALFSLLGTTYGGDGRTTFALPNLQATAKAMNLKACIAIQGIYPSRN